MTILPQGTRVFDSVPLGKGGGSPSGVLVIIASLTILPSTCPVVFI